MMSSTELVVVALTRGPCRASVLEDLSSPSDVTIGALRCSRLDSHVTPAAHQPHMDPLVKVGGQVWGFQRQRSPK